MMAAVAPPRTLTSPPVYWGRGARGVSRRDHPVRIKHEFLRRSLVEILVSLRRLIERDRGDVHRLGDLDLVVQDALHEGAVVAHDRALTGGELVALGPAQADADA